MLRRHDWIGTQKTRFVALGSAARWRMQQEHVLGTIAGNRGLGCDDDCSAGGHHRGVHVALFIGGDIAKTCCLWQDLQRQLAAAPGSRGAAGMDDARRKTTDAKIIAELKQQVSCGARRGVMRSRWWHLFTLGGNASCERRTKLFERAIRQQSRT